MTNIGIVTENGMIVLFDVGGHILWHGVPPKEMEQIRIDGRPIQDEYDAMRWG